MEDRWIVKNNTGSILSIPKFKIRLEPRGQIDIVRHTKKSVRDLKVDESLVIEFSHNNLVTIDIFDSSKKESNAEISGKLDLLFDVLKSQKKDTIVEKTVQQIDLSEIKDVIKKEIGNIEISSEGKTRKESDEEEKMREEAMKKLIEEGKAPEKNFDSLGRSKKLKDVDDHTDLIDF